MQLTARFNRSFTLADRSEKGDLLGTNAKPINGIFYVAALDHTADNMVRRRANLQAIGPNNAPQKHGCFPDVSRIAGAVQGNAAILFCPALIEFRTMSGSGKRADEGATK